MRSKGSPLAVSAALLATLTLAPPLLAQQPDPLVGSALPGPAGREVRWAASLQQATEMARSIPNGRLLVELTADGCGECDRMASLIHPVTSFFDFTRDKVPVRLSQSSDEGRRVAGRFGIRSVPAWVVMTTDGILCGMQVGASNGQAWFGTFGETENAWAAFARQMDEERQRPEDKDLVLAVATELFKRAGDQFAEPRFRRLGDDASARTAIREKALAYLATIELDSSRFDAAEASLEKLKKVGKDPILVQRAELRLADIEIARKRLDRAVARLVEFKKAHPDSPLVGQANDLLKRIQPTPEPAAAGTTSPATVK